MALNPYRRRVGVSQEPRPVRNIDTRIFDSGRSILRAAKTAERTLAPELADKAKREALADFASDGLGKDENGNYVIPEPPPGGGRVYSEAYEAAALETYVSKVYNDAELRLTTLYGTESALEKGPLELRGEAQALISGILEGVDERVKPDLFRTLTRELRERDRAFTGRWQRQNYNLTVNDLESGYGRSMERGISAFSLGGEEATIKGETHIAEAKENLERLVQIGAVPDSQLELFDEQAASARGIGKVLSTVREEGDRMRSADYIDLMNSLMGIADESALFGMEDLAKAIPSQDMRDALMRRIRPLAQQAAAEERAVADQYEVGSSLGLIRQGAGKPVGMTDSQFSKVAQSWAAIEGVDLTTPQGMVAAFQELGELPDKFYSDLFDGAAQASDEKLGILASLYGAMDAIPSADGSIRSVMPLKKADEAYLYHVTNALEMGSASMTEARQRADAMMRVSGEGTGAGSAVEVLRNASGLNRTEIEEAMGGALESQNVDIADLGPLAREAVTVDAAQMTAMGLPADKALESAARRFRGKWMQEDYALGAALRMRDGERARTWTPQREAVPRITDVAGARGARTTEWVKAYQPVLRNLMGQQLPGVPKPGQLEIGKNLWVQHAGLDTKGQSRMFHLVYYDPELSNAPVPVMGRQNIPLMVDLGRAASIQQGYAKEQVVERARAREAEGFMGQVSGFLTRAWDAIGDSADAYGRARAGEEMPEPERDFLEPKAKHLKVPTRNFSSGARTAGAVSSQVVTSKADLTSYKKVLSGGVESNDPNDENAISGASGLFQFMEGTFIPLYQQVFGVTEESARHAWATKRKDEGVQNRLMDAFTMRNRQILLDHGARPTMGMLYMMHFLGEGDGRKVLRSDLDLPLATALGGPRLDLIVSQNPRINPAWRVRDMIRWAHDALDR